MSSMVGGCMDVVWSIAARPKPFKQAQTMLSDLDDRRPYSRWAAALLASSAYADTLVTNANGVQVDAAGQVQHFTGLLIGDDGRGRARASFR